MAVGGGDIIVTAYRNYVFFSPFGMEVEWVG